MDKDVDDFIFEGCESYVLGEIVTGEDKVVLC